MYFETVNAFTIKGGGQTEKAENLKTRKMKPSNSESNTCGLNALRNELGDFLLRLNYLSQKPPSTSLSSIT